jgi:valyl-tRNA synthetase
MIPGSELTTILRAPYPAPPKKIEHAKEAHEMGAIMDVISAVRNIRGEHNVQPGKQIEVILRAHKKEVHKMLEKDQSYITALCRTSKLTIVDGKQEFKKCATAVAGDVDIFIPLAGMIDLGAEKTRLTKEIERIGKYAASLEGKLSNKNFVEKAPKDVVEAERAKLSEVNAELGKLKGALAELGE